MKRLVTVNLPLWFYDQYYPKKFLLSISILIEYHSGIEEFENDKFSKWVFKKVQAQYFIVSVVSNHSTFK